MLKAISIALAVFIVTPIWYYLLYKILVAVQATELMWFLYWVYLPVAVLLTVIKELVDKEE